MLIASEPREEVMGYVRKTFFASRILLLLGMAVATPAAAAAFDGEWNVQIASTNSACGSGEQPS
jgi:hypothetical protein